MKFILLENGKYYNSDCIKFIEAVGKEVLLVDKETCMEYVYDISDTEQEAKDIARCLATSLS